MTNQPGGSKEQEQVQIPPAQSKAPEIPALQTSLNEEKGKKTDREETTPISGPAEQPSEKRQRLDPLLEEEIIEETIDNLRDERVFSQQTSSVVDTSTSSHKQELERQHSVEVSSTRPQGK